MMPPISQNLGQNNTNKNKSNFFNMNDLNNVNSNSKSNNEEENSNDWILDMFDNDKNDKGLIFNSDCKNSGEKWFLLIACLLSFAWKSNNRKIFYYNFCFLNFKNSQIIKNNFDFFSTDCPHNFLKFKKILTPFANF